jgi:hypothetical protein
MVLTSPTLRQYGTVGQRLPTYSSFLSSAEVTEVAQLQ